MIGLSTVNFILSLSVFIQVNAAPGIPSTTPQTIPNHFSAKKAICNPILNIMEHKTYLHQCDDLKFALEPDDDSGNTVLCIIMYDLMDNLCHAASLKVKGPIIIPKTSKEFNQEINNIRPKLLSEDNDKGAENQPKGEIDIVCENIPTVFEVFKKLPKSNDSAPFITQFENIFKDPQNCKKVCGTFSHTVSHPCLFLLWAKNRLAPTIATTPATESPNTPAAKRVNPVMKKEDNIKKNTPKPLSTSEKKDSKITSDKPIQNVEIQSLPQEKKGDAADQVDEKNVLENPNIQESEKTKEDDTVNGVNDNRSNDVKDGDNNMNYEDDTATDTNTDEQKLRKDASMINFRGEEDNDGSHTFTYISILTLICCLFYAGIHNKQKILAFLLEGRRARRSRGSRRRPNTANYRKLDSNLEEAISSQCNTNTTQVIY